MKKRPAWAAYYLLREEVWAWFSIFFNIAWERSRSDIHHFWLRFELKNCDPLNNTGTTIRIWNLSFLFFSSSWFVIASAISILIAYRNEREKSRFRLVQIVSLSSCITCQVTLYFIPRYSVWYNGNYLFWILKRNAILSFQSKPIQSAFYCTNIFRGIYIFFFYRGTEQAVVNKHHNELNSFSNSWWKRFLFFILGSSSHTFSNSAKVIMVNWVSCDVTNNFMFLPNSMCFFLQTTKPMLPLIFLLSYEVMIRTRYMDAK